MDICWFSLHAIDNNRLGYMNEITRLKSYSIKLMPLMKTGKQLDKNDKQE